MTRCQRILIFVVWLLYFGLAHDSESIIIIIHCFCCVALVSRFSKGTWRPQSKYDRYPHANIHGSSSARYHPESADASRSVCLIKQKWLTAHSSPNGFSNGFTFLSGFSEGSQLVSHSVVDTETNIGRHFLCFKSLFHLFPLISFFSRFFLRVMKGVGRFSVLLVLLVEKRSRSSIGLLFEEGWGAVVCLLKKFKVH